MNKQKGLASLLIILLITVAVGGYLMYQNQKSILEPQQISQPIFAPTPSSKSSSFMDITNWKTYNSEEKIFSFKYPAEWIYETRKTTNRNYLFFGTPLTEEQREKQGYLNINDAPKTYRSFSLFYETSSDFSSKSLDELVEDLITTKENTEYKKNILIGDDMQAKEVGYGCQAFCIDILFKRNNTVFDASTGPNGESNISVLRQILSTFKFLP